MVDLAAVLERIMTARLRGVGAKLFLFNLISGLYYLGIIAPPRDKLVAG